MQYKPAVARLPTSTAQLLPFNPSSPFSPNQCSCTRWCHPAASSSLPCPLPIQLSCFPSSLSSPLSSCLVLGACYVIHLLNLFPCSVQHYCVLINANFHYSTTVVVPSYKARKRFLHEYFHLQIPVHSIIYRGYYMAARRYKISFWVLKNISLVRCAHLWDIFSTRKEKFCTSKRPCNVLFYYINTNEIPNHFTLIAFWCEKRD